MRLRDLSLLPELAQHFERSGFRVSRVEDTFEVEPPAVMTHAQAERAIQRHLDVWSLMYPDSITQPTSQQPG
jgi:hypothetical protein